jgi:hypothetical protein
MPRHVNINNEDLRRLHLEEGKAVSEIAAYFKCDGGTIRARLTKLGIFRREYASYKPGEKCSVETCDRPVDTKHLCQMHYQRLLKSGTTTARRLCSPDDPIRVRLAGRYTVTPAGCWEWNAAKNNKGYGQLNYQGRRLLAHRLSYESHNGPIPDGLILRHTCDNPPCINPKHLIVGTLVDNSRDMDERGRRVPTWRKGAAVPTAKLTEQQVREIRAKYIPIKYGTVRLGKEYGVSQALIHNIIKRKAWAWLT